MPGGLRQGAVKVKENHFLDVGGRLCFSRWEHYEKLANLLTNIRILSVALSDSHVSHVFERVTHSKSHVRGPAMPLVRRPKVSTQAVLVCRTKSKYDPMTSHDRRTPRIDAGFKST